MVARLMTTCFPLNAILMELSEQLDLRQSWLALNWAPRQQNTEADALTNGEFGDFDPAHRIDLDPNKIDWLVLGEMIEAGGGMVEELRVAREKKRAEKAAMKKSGRKRRLAAGALRDRDPW